MDANAGRREMKCDWEGKDGDGSQGHGEHCCSGREGGKRMMMTMSTMMIREVMTASSTILPHLRETTISHSAMALAKRGGVMMTTMIPAPSTTDDRERREEAEAVVL